MREKEPKKKRIKDNNDKRYEWLYNIEIAPKHLTEN